MKTHKTLVSHFNLFKLDCDKWLEFFGIHGFGVSYVHTNSDDLAEATYNIMTRSATISLGKDWGTTKPTPEELDATAFHEVCHLLIGRLSVIARSRYISESEIQEEDEHIVRVLENKIYPLIKEE